MRQFGRKPRVEMLEHLIDFEPPIESSPALVEVDDADPKDILEAQGSTVEWLKAMGAPTTAQADASAAASLAQNAFKALTAPDPDPQQRAALLTLKTPAAVQHLTGMLTAYDWEFVHQAKELRGYAVSKILEEVEHPDARIRLRALELLGRVTEVALFTDRVEVKKTELKDTELDAKIKEKLARFAGVVDVHPTDAVLLERTEGASHEAS